MDLIHKKVVSAPIQMQSFVPPDHGLHEKNRLISELDDLFYKLITSESVSCKIWELQIGFPRNSICIVGSLFRVSMISALNSERVRAKSIVIPRVSDLISRIRTDSSDGAHLSIESIAFEWKSHLRQIEEDTFYEWLSLRSICIPASVQILPQGRFDSCDCCGPFS
jgi:hypothetical protein